MSDKVFFQLTMVSQNDPGSNGDKISGKVMSFKGGEMESYSSPVNEKVHLPIPPAPNDPNPQTPPTWFIEVTAGITNASYETEVYNSDGTTTKIEIKGEDMAKWVEENDPTKTNQIYLESECGIFGYAQKFVGETGTHWIYTITTGVSFPVVHPG